MSYHISWGGLLLMGLAFLGFYFVLRLIHRLLATASVRRRGIISARKAMRFALLLYEPLAILVWGIFFVFKNLPFHALLLGLVLLAGFVHIRNYLSGRLIRLGHNISIGKKLRSGQVQGTAARLGNLGLYLQADDGMHYLSYSRLLTEGYTLLSGEDVSSVFHLSIASAEEESPEGQVHQVMDLLASSPYLDWNHSPERIAESTGNGRLEVRVVAREESHMYELVQWLQELGYSCKIVNSK